LAGLAALGAAPALAATPSASFTLTGALHATAASRCFVSSFQGDQSVDFFNAKVTIKVNEYKSAGAVKLAKTRDDFVSVDEIVGGKSSMWVAGWSGASDSGVPSTVGPHLGSGTLQVSAANLAAGTIITELVPAPKDLMPVNAAKGTVHLVARWSGCLTE
jgi:hypothetical protein